jgi:hypothetical protein
MSAFLNLLSLLLGPVILVTVLDDSSRRSVVRSTAQRADIPTVLQTVIGLLETQPNRCVQRTRSDRGGEFVTHIRERF